MGELRVKFRKEKAIEVILYIVSRITDPTYHSIICDDDYYAMELGPVPSNTYDLMKETKETVASHEYDFRIEGHTVIPLREPNLGWLSESDIECLDQSIRMYGRVPFWKRKEDSHDQAWREAWEARGDQNSNRMSVESIAGMLEESEGLIDYLASRHAD
jgi:hypothetical protein